MLFVFIKQSIPVIVSLFNQIFLFYSCILDKYFCFNMSWAQLQWINFYIILYVWIVIIYFPLTADEEY